MLCKGPQTACGLGGEQIDARSHDWDPSPAPWARARLLMKEAGDATADSTTLEDVSRRSQEPKMSRVRSFSPFGEEVSGNATGWKFKESG
jgi:hypothetical protein